MKNKEMYDLLVQAIGTLTPHEQAQLATVVSKAVTLARATQKSAFAWGCPKCVRTSALKIEIVNHLTSEHRTKAEMAQWMPVPITEEEFNP